MTDIKTIKVTFVKESDQGSSNQEGGSSITIDAPVGLSILEVAHKYDIAIEGSCGGALACSTCHVILESEMYDSLDDPSEEEEDMLDLAFGLTRTSRLGCQIILTSAMDGMKIVIPAKTRNILLED